MSVGIDHQDTSTLNEKAGALGVFAGYIHSTDQVPIISSAATGSTSLKTLSTTTSGVNQRKTRNRGAATGTEDAGTFKEEGEEEIPSSATSHLPTPPEFNIPALDKISTYKLSTFEKGIETKDKYEVSKFEVGLKVLGDLAGKDKLAKVALYSMRIITVYALAYSKDYPKEFSNISYNNTFKAAVQLCKTPKLLAGLLSRLFLDRSEGAMSALALYRPMMRFGKTPFRLRNLIVSLVHDFAMAKDIQTFTQVARKSLFNEARLAEFINLYYGIADELLLLFKFGVYKNMAIRRWAGKHEGYSWYMDILLSLKQNYCKMLALNEREKNLRLNQQVRIKARQVIRNLKLENSNSSSPIRKTLTTDSYDQELGEISKEKRILKLSILGLLCDFCFDSVDLYKLTVDRRLYLSFGLMSACLGLTKVYIKHEEETRSAAALAI